jgi:hypothetical protein
LQQQQQQQQLAAARGLHKPGRDQLRMCPTP